MFKRKTSFSQGSGKRLKRQDAFIQKTVVKAVARTSEKKGYDTNIDTGPIVPTTATSENAFVLNVPIPGTNSWQRVGRKIHLDSLRLKGTLIMNVQTPTSVNGNVVRMVVVWDRQGIPGAFSNVFGATDIAGTETSQVLDPVRYDGLDRFFVLRDTTIALNSSAQLSTLPTVVYSHFDEFINLKGKSTSYSGQNGASTDITQGALIVYFRTTNDSGLNADCYVRDSIARLRYHE